MEFYRDKAWRILALQKYLSTVYVGIVPQGSPSGAAKTLTVSRTSGSLDWQGFTGPAFVEKLRRAGG
jgi:hypothetical protein